MVTGCSGQPTAIISNRLVRIKGIVIDDSSRISKLGKTLKPPESSSNALNRIQLLERDEIRRKILLFNLNAKRMGLCGVNQFCLAVWIIHNLDAGEFLAKPGGRVTADTLLVIHP